MSAISLFSLSLASLSSLSSLCQKFISLILALSSGDRLFHVKLAEWAGLASSLSYVAHITTKPIDNFGRAPYPEGMRGGRVNTNIWQWV